MQNRFGIQCFGEHGPPLRAAQALLRDVDDGKPYVLRKMTAGTLLRGACHALLVSGALMRPGASHALPQGGVVSSGTANIATAGNTTTITQSTNKAIIDWNSFNVNSGEHVNFVQPGTSSITLNRIHDANPSVINGEITANGKVWLVNSNGVFFGSGAQINVAGLVATTADIDNANFDSGNYTFTHPGNPNATIQNDGSITVAQAGLAAFVAPNVVNNGTITARLGKVALASGDTFALDMYGDGLVSVTVSPAVAQQLVKNTGSISATGGQVQLTAAAASNIVSSLVNNTGIIEANAAGIGQNGEITLFADGHGGTSVAKNSGTLSASGYGAGQTGGTVEVLGDQVSLMSGSHIDVSGDAGGGTVHVGGNFHGAGATPTSFLTYVDSISTIDADAVTTGSGGNVAVWANDTTYFYGDIHARGGSVSGDGGQVETSGHTLYALGTVDAGATNGAAGSWLLDPYNVTIAAGAGVDANAGCAGNPEVCTPTNDATIYADNISATLSGGTSVTITTGAGGASSGDITVSTGATITDNHAGTESLTMSAYRNITFSGTAAVTTTVGKLNVILDSNTGGGGGYVQTGSGTISTNGGDIYMGGGALDGSGHPIDAAYGHSNWGIIATSLNAGGGNIVISGMGDLATGRGVAIGSVVTSGTGTISITGTALSTVTNRVGVQLGGATVTAGTGAITITGVNNSITSSGNYGITINGATTITGAGPITLNATSTSAANALEMDSGTIQSTSGATVTLNAWGNLMNITGGSITSSNASAFSANFNGHSGIAISGGTVNANGGSIAMTATGFIPGAGDSSNDYGIYLTGGTLQTSGAGTITLTGTGGGSGAGSANYGIYMTGGLISGGAGTVTLDGTEGTGTGYGIDVTLGVAANVIQTTGGGEVLLKSPGAIVLTKANINSTNATAFKFVADANDTGGGTSGSFVASGSTIATSGGDIWIGGQTLDGSGNPTGAAYRDSNSGVGATITGATTLSSAGGNITINGAVAAGATGSRIAASIGGASSITSGAGAITITGVNAATASSGDYGILLGTTTITGAGPITFNATSTGAAYSLNMTNATIQSTSGATVTLNGWGNIIDISGGTITSSNASAFSTILNGHVGINIEGGTLNANGGSITLTGTGYTSGAVDTSNEYGIYMTGGTLQTSGAGTITLTGTGGGGGAGSTNYGIYMTGGLISGGAGTVTLDGTNGVGTGYGVDINLGIAANVIQTTGGGEVLLKSPGAIYLNKANINSTNATAFKFVADANDTGGATSGSIQVQGGTIATSGGNIWIGGQTLDGSGNPTGAAYGDANAAAGVTITAAETLNSAGGNITINGAVRAGGSAGNGVGIGSASIISSGAGSITVTGVNAATGSASDFGIVLSTSTITGAGPITFSGTSTTVAYSINMTNATIQSTSGATVTLNGWGNGMSISGGTITSSNATAFSAIINGHAGIAMSGGTINANGGSITMTGTGYTPVAGNVSNDYGVNISGGTLQTTGAGTITLTGTGTGLGAGNSNYGIYMTGGLISGGTGTITLDGTEGVGAGYGIDIALAAPANAIRTTGGGKVLLKSPGAINLTNANINSTNATAFKFVVDANDIGGGTSGSIGISGSTIATSGGDIWLGGRTLDGSGNPTGWAYADANSAHGITLASGTTLSSAGGAITLLAGDSFVNTAGAGALNAGAGRWLIYSVNPSADTDGGLANNFRRYSCTYGGSCPSFAGETGNGFLYSYTPVLTVTANGQSLIAAGAPIPDYTYHVSGYLTGADLAADNITGSAIFTSAYVRNGPVGAYSITFESTSLADKLGYGFTYVSSTLFAGQASVANVVDSMKSPVSARNSFLSGKSDGSNLIVLMSAEPDVRLKVYEDFDADGASIIEITPDL
jgi:filamentous hemagglutinin family protein